MKAVIGAIVVAIPGGIIGVVVGTAEIEGAPCPQGMCGLVPFYYGIFGVILGAIGGAIIGSVIAGMSSKPARPDHEEGADDQWFGHF